MKIVYRIIALIIFSILLIAVISYARGYRFNPQNNRVTPTGILAVISWPKAASIYINGQLKGVTDTNLTLVPGKYTVEVKKEGYTSWQKTLILKGELVESAEAVLFPVNPSLSPLTNIGVTRAVAVENTDRVLIFSQNDKPEKDGVYLYDANKKPISFLPPLKLLVLKTKLAGDVDFSKATVSFSPDLKQTIVDFTAVAYLLSLDENNDQPLDVTNSKEALFEAWNEEKQKEIQTLLGTYPKDIAQIATDSFQIISFSPDKLRFLYRAQKKMSLPVAIKPPLIGTNQTPEKRDLFKNQYYVYDKKEDKNYPITVNPDQTIIWFPDSRHLVINEAKQISIKDYDDTNKQTVYSGPFDADFLAMTSDDKLLVLINLNPKNNRLPDIYAVGIR